MKSAQPEASSDFERARALSRALTAPAVASTPSPSGPSYTRLKPRTPAQAAAPALAVLPALARDARWPAIVAWAASTEGATGALAVDRTGLLVAVTGLADEEATRIGGRLALAFDHASEVEQIEALVIEGQGRAIHVASFGAGDETVLLAVFGGAARPDPIRRAVLASLGG